MGSWIIDYFACKVSFYFSYIQIFVRFYFKIAVFDGITYDMVL